MCLGATPYFPLPLEVSVHTSTSSETSLMSTETVHTNRVQEGHLDFHTAPELERRVVQFSSMLFTSTETIQAISPGQPPRLSHSS